MAIIKDDILKGHSLVMSISKLFNKIEGTASCAILPQYEESLFYSQIMALYIIVNLKTRKASFTPQKGMSSS